MVKCELKNLDAEHVDFCCSCVGLYLLCKFGKFKNKEVWRP
jgi:hypothetical protein